MSWSRLFLRDDDDGTGSVDAAESALCLAAVVLEVVRSGMLVLVLETAEMAVGVTGTLDWLLRPAAAAAADEVLVNANREGARDPPLSVLLIA